MEGTSSRPHSCVCCSSSSRSNPTEISSSNTSDQMTSSTTSQCAFVCCLFMSCAHGCVSVCLCNVLPCLHVSWYHVTWSETSLLFSFLLSFFFFLFSSFLLFLLLRYLRALGAFYLRLTSNSLDCYKVTSSSHHVDQIMSSHVISHDMSRVDVMSTCYSFIILACCMFCIVIMCSVLIYHFSSKRNVTLLFPVFLSIWLVVTSLSLFHSIWSLSTMTTERCEKWPSKDVSQSDWLILVFVFCIHSHIHVHTDMDVMWCDVVRLDVWLYQSQYFRALTSHVCIYVYICVCLELEVLHMDEFIDMLLTEERVFDIILPVIQVCVCACVCTVYVCMYVGMMSFSMFACSMSCYMYMWNHPSCFHVGSSYAWEDWHVGSQSESVGVGSGGLRRWHTGACDVM